MLTGLSKALLVAIAVIAAILAAADWTSWVSLPLVLIPPVLFARELYWKRLRSHQTLRDGRLDDQFVRIFFGTFLPAALIVLVVELILTVAFAAMLLREQLRAAAQAAEDSQEEGQNMDLEKLMENMRGTNPAGPIFFVIFTAFITAATTEEVAKTMNVRFHCCGATPDQACCLQPRPYTARGTLSLFLASALGFSTIENLLYVLLSGGGIGGKIVLSLVRGLVSMPVHVVSTLLIGIRLAHRDLDRLQQQDGKSFEWMRILAPGIAVHGFFDLVAFALPVALYSLDDLLNALITLLVAGVCVLAVSIYFTIKQTRELLEREDRYIALETGHDAEHGGGGGGGATAGAWTGAGNIPVAQPVGYAQATMPPASGYAYYPPPPQQPSQQQGVELPKYPPEHH